MEKDRKLTKLLLKIGQQKAVLGKERSKIKKQKGKKIHKFFMERKKWWLDYYAVIKWREWMSMNQLISILLGK